MVNMSIHPTAHMSLATVFKLANSYHPDVPEIPLQYGRLAQTLLTGHHCATNTCRFIINTCCVITVTCTDYLTVTKLNVMNG